MWNILCLVRFCSLYSLNTNSPSLPLPSRSDCHARITGLACASYRKHGTWQEALAAYTNAYAKKDVKVFPDLGSKFWTTPIGAHVTRPRTSDEAYWRYFDDDPTDTDASSLTAVSSRLTESNVSALKRTLSSMGFEWYICHLSTIVQHLTQPQMCSCVCYLCRTVTYNPFPFTCSSIYFLVTKVYLNMITTILHHVLELHVPPDIGMLLRWQRSCRCNNVQSRLQYRNATV